MSLVGVVGRALGRQTNLLIMFFDGLKPNLHNNGFPFRHLALFRRRARERDLGELSLVF